MRPGMPLVSPGAGRIPPVPLQQPQNLFRFGEQTTYSTQLFQAGAIASTTNRLFTVPIGSTGQGFINALTIAETNLKEGGRVPSGVAYDVYGVATQVLQSSAAADGGTFSVAQDTQALISNLINIQNNGVLSWDFTQTVVDICPISLAGAGGGAFGSVSTGNAADSGAMNNGNGGVWMYKKYPVALPGNSTFSIVIRFGSRAAAIAGNSVGVRVVLLGYYKNVIEIG